MVVPTFLNKPELWFRPSHLVRRLFRPGPPPAAAINAVLPWGLPLHIRVRENIGKQVVAFGLFELPVCEAIARLVDPGDQVWDVGANIGHMTGLLAIRSGPTGTVQAFEPHPDILPQLQANIDSWKSRRDLAAIRLHPVALSDRAGSATLFDAPDTSVNCGLGSLMAHEGQSRTFTVPTARLDDLLGNERIDLLKLDVEGAEIRVLEGARETLRQKRIRDVLFEDHIGHRSPAALYLADHGYTVFHLGVRFRGPWLAPAGSAKPPLRPWDSPNGIATLDPDRVRDRLASSGWTVLRRP
jgi:FkbM family methyltransferase